MSKNLSNRIKEICSITVKNEGRALNLIFVLCLICIYFFSLHLYRVSTNFYKKLDNTIENNVNFNIQVLRNETYHNIEIMIDSLDNKL